MTQVAHAGTVRLCRNCHQPPGTHGLDGGRCNACANYHRRTGEERPKRLWL